MTLQCGCSIRRGVSYNKRLFKIHLWFKAIERTLLKSFVFLFWRFGPFGPESWGTGTPNGPIVEEYWPWSPNEAWSKMPTEIGHLVLMSFFENLCSSMWLCFIFKNSDSSLMYVCMYILAVLQVVRLMIPRGISDSASWSYFCWWILIIIILLNHTPWA